MQQLYFASTLSTISALLAAVFAVFFALVTARRDGMTHWTTFVLILFFLWLATSIMSSMKTESAPPPRRPNG